MRNFTVGQFGAVAKCGEKFVRVVVLNNVTHGTNGRDVLCWQGFEVHGQDNQQTNIINTRRTMQEHMWHVADTKAQSKPGTRQHTATHTQQPMNPCL